MVGDRAELVERLDGEPTTGIRLDSMLFLRLTGGRLEADTSGGEITLEGDPRLAVQLAAGLAYTI